LTLTQEQWAKSWISTGSVLIDGDANPPTSSGHVTKRFALKAGPKYSTVVAFYFPGYLGMTHETLDNNNLQIDVCRDNNCFTSYTQIENGHDKHDCPTTDYEVTYSDGAGGTVTRTYSPPYRPEETVIPTHTYDEIQHMIYNHMQTVAPLNPASNCRYGSQDAPISDTHMINIFQFECKGGASSAIEVKYTDTEAGW
jgi:hypothetical protein